MAAAETGAAQRSAMQDYKSCCLFFSQALWDTLLAEPAPSALQRVDAVVGYLVGTLGLRHPSEPTVAVITAVCAAGAEQSGMQLQSLFVTVKSLLRTATARARLKSTPLPGNVYIEVLPNNVDELPLAARQAAGPHGFAPIPATMDHQEILRLARSIPLRSTNRQVQLQRQMEQHGQFLGGGQQGSVAAFQMMHTAQMAQAAMAMATAIAGQSARPSTGELTNLQILGVPKSAPTAPSAGLNALLERSQSAAQGDGETATAMGAAASSARPLLALTDAQPSAVVPAAVLAEPSSDQSVCQPPEAVLEVQQTPAMPAATPVLSLTDAPATPSPEAAGGGTVPNQVEAAMVRLAHSYYEKELPSELPDGKGGMKRPAAAKGRPRKRPAVSAACAASVEPSSSAAAPVGGAMTRPGSAQAMKKPAKAECAAICRRPASKSSGATLKAIPLVTQKQRMKWRPHGCPTCRNTPGCCPSCWLKRGYRLA